MKQVEERIVREVRRWSKGKGIKQMLNELSGKKGPGCLTKMSAFNEVAKTYKRVLVKIHPDKNMDSFEALARATEQFKIVNALFNAYKERQQS